MYAYIFICHESPRPPAYYESSLIFTMNGFYFMNDHDKNRKVYKQSKNGFTVSADWIHGLVLFKTLRHRLSYVCPELNMRNAKFFWEHFIY